MNRTSVYKMGKYKNANKAGRGAQRYTFPTLLFWGGKPEDTAHDLLEEVSMQTGASPKVPFRFTQSSRLPSLCLLSAEGRWACSVTPDSQTHYCIHMRVTLGEEGGDQPPPFHAWSGLLITDMFQEGLKEQITEAVILAPGKAILFFGRWLCREGLPFGSARDIRFSLTGPVNWAGRMAWVEATVNTVQEGSQAIADEDEGQRAWESPRVRESHPVFGWCQKSRQLEARFGWDNIWWGSEKNWQLSHLT